MGDEKAEDNAEQQQQEGHPEPQEQVVLVKEGREEGQPQQQQRVEPQRPEQQQRVDPQQPEQQQGQLGELTRQQVDEQQHEEEAHHEDEEEDEDDDHQQPLEQGVAAPVHRKKHTRGRRRSKAGRLCSEITPEEMSMHFHQSIEVAAVEMRVGVTALKKLCRKFKIHKWPYRRFQRTLRLTSAAKAGMARVEDYQRLTELVMDPQLCPESPVWTHIDPSERYIIDGVFEAADTQEFKDAMEKGATGGAPSGEAGGSGGGGEPGSPTGGSMLAAVPPEAARIVQRTVDELGKNRAQAAQRAAAAAGLTAATHLPSALAGMHAHFSQQQQPAMFGALPHHQLDPTASVPNPFRSYNLIGQGALMGPPPPHQQQQHHMQQQLAQMGAIGGADGGAVAAVQNLMQVAAAVDAIRRASIPDAAAASAAGGNGQQQILGQMHGTSFPQLAADSLPAFLETLRQGSLNASDGSNALLATTTYGNPGASLLNPATVQQGVNQQRGSPAVGAKQDASSNQQGHVPPPNPFAQPAPFLPALHPPSPARTPQQLPAQQQQQPSAIPGRSPPPMPANGVGGNGNGGGGMGGNPGLGQLNEKSITSLLGLGGTSLGGASMLHQTSFQDMLRTLLGPSLAPADAILPKELQLQLQQHQMQQQQQRMTQEEAAINQMLQAAGAPSNAQLMSALGDVLRQGSLGGGFHPGNTSAAAAVSSGQQQHQGGQQHQQVGQQQHQGGLQQHQGGLQQHQGGLQQGGQQQQQQGQQQQGGGNRGGGGAPPPGDMQAVSQHPGSLQMTMTNAPGGAGNHSAMMALQSLMGGPMQADHQQQQQHLAQQAAARNQWAAAMANNPGMWPNPRGGT